VSLLDLLAEFLGRIFVWWWLDRETQRADLTAVDMFLRFSVAAGVAVAAIWLAFRFA